MPSAVETGHDPFSVSVTTLFLLPPPQNPLDIRPPLGYRWRMDDALRDLAAENSIFEATCILPPADSTTTRTAPPSRSTTTASRGSKSSSRRRCASNPPRCWRKPRRCSKAEPEPTVNPASLQPSQARPDVTTDLIGTLDSVRATLKLRHINEASDDEVEEALRMADEALANARGAGQRPLRCPARRYSPMAAASTRPGKAVGRR